jgi:hypothetical protein
MGKKVLGLVNQRIYTQNTDLHERSASLTILRSLAAGTEPIYCAYREETNSQWDFVDFVLFCCRKGALVAGYFLVVDNATVHNAFESRPVLNLILEFYGVTLLFLPAYSPELNPCELIFAQIKERIRNYRSGDSIFDEVMKSLASVSTEQVFAYYMHCIFPKHILPDISL